MLWCLWIVLFPLDFLHYIAAILQNISSTFMQLFPVQCLAEGPPTLQIATDPVFHMSYNIPGYSLSFHRWDSSIIFRDGYCCLSHLDQVVSIYCINMYFWFYLSRLSDIYKHNQHNRFKKIHLKSSRATCVSRNKVPAVNHFQWSYFLKKEIVPRKNTLLLTFINGTFHCTEPHKQNHIHLHCIRAEVISLNLGCRTEMIIVTHKWR